MIENIELDEQLEKVKELIYKEPVVIEFLAIRERIANDVYLKALVEKINEHKKLMSQNIDNDSTYFDEKDQYEKLQKEYETNPMVVNYNSLREEVASLLSQIHDILQ